MAESALSCTRFQSLILTFNLTLNHFIMQSSESPSAIQLSSLSPRRTQIVSSKVQRRNVIRWMINKVSTSGTSAQIADRFVLHFRAVFRGTYAKTKLASLKKAHRWWKGKEAYLEALNTPENKALYVVSRHIPGISMK